MRPHAPARTVHRARVALLVTLLTALAAPPVAGQADSVDAPLFQRRDGVVAGAFLLGTGVAFALDRSLADAFQDPGVQAAGGLRSAAWTFNHLAVPGTFVLGAGLYGAGLVVGRHDLADVGLHVGESLALATALSFTVKALAGRARPYVDRNDPFDFGAGRGFRGSAYRSFPSGHTTLAFAAAAAAATELDRLWPGHRILVAVLTYAPATLVGVARMFDNRHWASDVVLGAAIGSFAGWKTVRYMHQRQGNTLDRWFLGATLTPGGWGVRLSLAPAP